MHYLAVLVLLTLSSTASASDRVDQRSITPVDVCRDGPRLDVERRLCNKRRLQNARATRRWGQGLTYTGAVIAGAGAGLALLGGASMGGGCRGPDVCEISGAGLVFGGLGVLAGGPLLAVGVPMWMHGKRREVQLRPRIELGPAEQRVGLTIVY